jgi:peptidoglycan/xylan/chitin deacetylase (PgdA/CDA1 family)
MDRRSFLSTALAAMQRPAARIPARTVVLTFDDAVKSHRTFVAPLLKELGFRATFFVTHRWMEDRENFMTWAEIAEIHKMGFEIGNHSWTHGNFSNPLGASRMAGELALVENELKKAGVPRPVSYAHCANNFGPEALQVLREGGFRFARRGMQPEAEYGTLQMGPVYDPSKHHPLLVPTTGDAYPNWTLEQFQRVISRAEEGRAVVLQFHGVPDTAHPWVHTPPEKFRGYMEHLKQNGFHALALRDLEPFANLANPPADPLLKSRFPQPKSGAPPQPKEVAATQADLPYWLDNMRNGHHYTAAETARVCGRDEGSLPPAGPAGKPMRVRPYPGGRHPRIGFLEGAIDPLRGTKASVFLPWDTASYVVIDLPEAIFSNLGLIFLAHTHVPTVWNEQNVIIENVDWNRRPDGGLNSRWTLPNGVEFGGSVEPGDREVAMELFLRNGTKEPLTKLRTQICVMLKGAPEFNAQTLENKELKPPEAAVRSANGRRWIRTSWERSGRVWGNPQCPCMHSDPVLPDCAPGETVRVRGRLWFEDRA